MNSIARLIIYFCALFGLGNIIIPPVLAQQPSPDPVVSLSVKDEALVDALKTVSLQTGYQFDLTPKWEKHLVSASIDQQPLEHVLKRLLRRLNYTILWEADKMVIIKVYGEADPRQSTGISFASPPQEIQEEEEPSMESDDEATDEEDDEDGEAVEKDQKELPDFPDKPGPRGKKAPIRKPAPANAGRLTDSKQEE